MLAALEGVQSLPSWPSFLTTLLVMLGKVIVRQQTANLEGRGPPRLCRI